MKQTPHPPTVARRRDSALYSVDTEWSSTFDEGESPPKKLKQSNSIRTNQTSPALPWKSHFTLPGIKPKFKWEPPITKNVDPSSNVKSIINPNIGSYKCVRLLLEDAFIDKSAALYNLLGDCFDVNANDFSSVPLLLVYPRHFGKTTLLGLIEALYSPLPELNGAYDAEKVKTKILSLEHGDKLLKCGLHPVVSLDLQGVLSVDGLNRYIAHRLQRAGLDDFIIDQALNPSEQLTKGVEMLNTKFKADTGVTTKTIVLIDEFDQPFRDRKGSNDDELLVALHHLFALGNVNGTGISLLVLCGLTRMVKLDHFVDVSQNTVHHGICGISANELVNHCAKDHPLGHSGRALEKFVSESGLGGFRFGLNKVNSSNGDLMSPLDVWEIIRSLLEGDKQPSPQWINSMESDFDLTCSAENYTSSVEGSQELLNTLKEGLVNPMDPYFKLKREDYLVLDNHLHVQKVLFELGLLTVKAVHDKNEVILGPPNETVMRVAIQLLEKERKRGLKHRVMDSSTINLSSVIFTDQTQKETSFSLVNIQENDVVKICRNEADDMRLVPLFFRKHLVDQLARVNEYWDDPVKWKLYVTGAPGCGKTCFFWVWADILRQSNKRVLFIQYQKQKRCQLWVLEGDAKNLLTSPIVQQDNLISATKVVLEGMTSRGKFDVCICDGVRANDPVCSALLGVLDSRSGRKTGAVISKLVLVTSVQFDVKNGDELGTAPYVKKLSFDSWTLADYEMAAKSDLVKDELIRSILLKDWEAPASALQIYEDEKMLEVVNQKYHFAGGCARYMFEMNGEQLQTELNTLCDRVERWTPFTKTKMAYKTYESVNTLMQSFSVSERESMCTPVSKYVMRRAYDECGEELTAAVESVAKATNNPTLKGWAFELSQLDKISSCA